ncbi:putative RNA-directed DNA polymerase from transposon X-element [Stylophora pistillata]|uniref:Putative RNA-directed DNA polymerase from transposon X-element n=1 Tax=Stylophora pistillata TaxID=50429 RepID=A0A2B4SBW5_STYPI|nr:putative RNA-directed DNA polymerase from transposon X-element [Stylophora pistillata]
MLTNLHDSLLKIVSSAPNAGIILAGDFNRADVSSLTNQFHLSQVVKIPIRGNRILDKIMTNLSDYYNAPADLPPFGLSDHCTFGLRPKARLKTNVPSKRVIGTRVSNSESKMAFGRYITGLDWSLIDTMDSVQDKYSVLSELIQIGLDSILPTKRVKIHQNDAPWISLRLKSLISRRQTAYHSRNKRLFNYYRNMLNSVMWAPSIAGGPDDIPNWVLRESALEVVQPEFVRLNPSFITGSMPEIWKYANVTPLAKVNNIEDIEKDLTPISLTPTLSKIAEHFAVQEHVKPVLKKLCPDQFGCIPGSSTTHALIGMFHNWTRALDGTGNCVRAFTLDYKKAFDLIGHSLLMAKLLQYDINPYIMNWIASFLSKRQQRVKLGHDCFSEWRSVRAGVSQGTKLGPWLFLVLLNDLSADTSNGDTTVYEIV